MATAASTNDYFGTARPAIRTRNPSSGILGPTASPGSPRTPLLGRSVSSQFGSPSAYRSEPEDVIIYELGARHLCAGFAGETRPRCVICFNPDIERRVGDYRAYDSTFRRKHLTIPSEKDWGSGHELYHIDIQDFDLGLAEDRLDRVIRMIQTDHLQLDQKARKAVLAIPSLLPTPLLEMVLKVLFNASAQLPAVTILTTPVLACVGAGVRNAVVVEIGWEETVVTAVGEYRQVSQRRTVRAGKMLTRETAKVIEQEVANQRTADTSTEDVKVDFAYAEDVTQRMCWCRSRSPNSLGDKQSSMVKVPAPDFGTDSQKHLHISFQRLSTPADITFFSEAGADDHNITLPLLIYRVLLALPLDLRALCVSRIIITGGVSALPGLKSGLLAEVSYLIETRGWDPVNNYGSATAYHERVLRERSANVNAFRVNPEQSAEEPALSPLKKPIQEDVPHAERIHDDKYDNITQKAEREARKSKPEILKGVIRGVETLGSWTGASLAASLKVTGAHEVEREDVLKHGLKDDGILI